VQDNKTSFSDRTNKMITENDVRQGKLNTFFKKYYKQKTKSEIVKNGRIINENRFIIKYLKEPV
jgi:hypothetical protein